MRRKHLTLVLRAYWPVLGLLAVVEGPGQAIGFSQRQRFAKPSKFLRCQKAVTLPILVEKHIPAWILFEVITSHGVCEHAVEQADGSGRGSPTTLDAAATPSRLLRSGRLA